MQYIITIAASLVVLLAIGFLFRKDQSQKIKLYTEMYFFTFSFLLMLQSDANENDNLKFKILKAFTALIYIVVLTFLTHCLYTLVKSCIIRRVRGMARENGNGGYGGGHGGDNGGDNGGDGCHRTNVGTR